MKIKYNRIETKYLATAVSLFVLSACALETGAEETGSDQTVSVQSEALLAPPVLRVLLVGNSQLGFGGGGPQVGPALKEYSDRSNITGNFGNYIDMKVDVANAGVGSCDELWNYTNANHYMEPRERAGSGQYDVVILQPPFYEADPNVNTLPCWDRFRKLAQRAGAEFGLLATNTIQDWYATSAANPVPGDVRLWNVIHNYAVSNGLLAIPAGTVLRTMLGTNPSSAVLDQWYQANEHAHPNARAAYAYVASLYQFITWRYGTTSSDPLAALGQPAASAAEVASMKGIINSLMTNSRSVALYAKSNNKFVTAENAGSTALVNDASDASSWQSFRIVSNTDGTVSFQATINNKYVCADAMGSLPLIANRATIGPGLYSYSWEKFIVDRVQGTRFFKLRALVNNKYVVFNANGTTPVIASGSPFDNADSLELNPWFMERVP